MRRGLAVLLSLAVLLGVVTLSGCGDGKTGSSGTGGSTTTTKAEKTNVTVPLKDGGYKEEIYNTDELPVEVYTYDADGVLQGFVIYDYEGKLLKRERYFDGERNGINSFEYTYDTDGVCLQKDEYNNDHMIQNTWVYNADGTTLWTGFDPWGHKVVTLLGTDEKPTYSDEYEGDERVSRREYNADGSYTRFTYYDDGSVEWHETYTTDDKRLTGTWYREDKTVSATVQGNFETDGTYTGEIITYYGYGNDGKAVETYNANGKILSLYHYDGDTLQWGETFEYDNKERPIRRNCYGENGQLTEFYETKYHPDGWRQYEIRYDCEGNKDYAEEYDKDGNSVGFFYH